MDASHKRKVAVGTVVALALAGGGAAIAAKQLGLSSSSDSKAVVNDAAKQLGVQPTALSNALKKALSDRVDAAVAAGRLTKQQGAELKQRIQSGDFPLFGVPGGDFHGDHAGHFMGLDAAATYLGLTEAQVNTRLEGGKTLAQIAKDQNKSVDGLITALKDNAKKKLDDAVSAGELTKTEEQQILSNLDQRITDLVNGKLARPDHAEGFGFGGRPGFDGGGPPAGFPGAAA